MDAKRALLAAAFALTLAPATPAGARKAFPPPPFNWVHNEGVLSPSAERAISEKLEAFHRATGKQLVVAAFRSLEGESLEDWTNRLFREWRIGDAKRNDGLLFSLFLDDRKWRVEVGFGLEGVVTDLQASRAARESGSPRFKQGDFDGGALAVVDRLTAILRGDEPAPAPDRPPSRRSGLSFPAAFWIFAAIIVVFQSLTPRRRTRLGGGGWSSGWGGGGDWGGGGGFSDGGGFSGGGGSSGGGGASGDW